jgi:V/A-type H+-transporting ATPase subunit D
VAEVKFTKNELRIQQSKLGQLTRYLPTLQLKKAMLQAQANEVRGELAELKRQYDEQLVKVSHFSGLLSQYVGVDPLELGKVRAVHKRYENIAGVEIPIYEGVDFAPVEYRLFDTPPWLDPAYEQLRSLGEAQVKVGVAEEKKKAIEKELREVSIRVNLFEKVLIPRAQDNIKQIKVFLGDQQLAAVARAKVAKQKVVMAQRKKQAQESARNA